MACGSSDELPETSGDRGGDTSSSSAGQGGGVSTGGNAGSGGDVATGGQPGTGGGLGGAAETCDFVPLRSANFDLGPQGAICVDDRGAPPSDGLDWTLDGAAMLNTYDNTGPAGVNGTAFAGRVSLLQGGVSMGGGWNRDNGGVIENFKVGEGGSYWMRLFVWIPATFDWTTSSGNIKFFRLGIDASARGVGNAGKLDMKILNGGVGWKMEFDEVRSFADSSATTGIFKNDSSNTPIPTERWVNLEWYVLASRDPAKGIMRFYMDGVLQLEYDDGATITLGSSTDKLKGVFFGTNYNDGSPVNQHLWIDGFMLTTDANPPSNLGSDGNPIIGDCFE